jgi:hypothetical protein
MVSDGPQNSPGMKGKMGSVENGVSVQILTECISRACEFIDILPQSLPDHRLVLGAGLAALGEELFFHP